MADAPPLDVARHFLPLPQISCRPESPLRRSCAVVCCRTQASSLARTHGRTLCKAASSALYARRTHRTPCKSVVISSPTSAPAVLPSRSCAPRSAFAAVATTEIASDSRPMISPMSGFAGGRVLARSLGRACCRRRDDRAGAFVETFRFEEPIVWPRSRLCCGSRSGLYPQLRAALQTTQKHHWGIAWGMATSP